MNCWQKIKETKDENPSILRQLVMVLKNLQDAYLL